MAEESNNLTIGEGRFNDTGDWAPTDIPKVRQLSWEDLTLAVVLCIFIIITVVGNTLVILAVLTTRRLRTVTNCYVMSLAVADWLVGVFVMPPKVAIHLMGSWELGGILCDIWISLDVLCCTASILSLCAISVDRYLAVTQPLNYSRRRRSKKLALLMILVVWLAAIAITCPPILGWYDVNHHKNKTCRYNQNEGYVIFSAMGSFFIPLIVMLYVYARISCVVAKRHDKLRQVQTDSKKSRKFISCQEESECTADRGSYDGEDKSHQPIIKSTSLSNSSGSHYATTTTTTSAVHHQRPARSHQSQCTDPHHSSSGELSGHQTRLNHYGAGSVHRSSRPESLIVDMGPGDHSFGKVPSSGEATPTSCCHGFSFETSFSHPGIKTESTSRVSSFRRESKTTRTLTIVVGGFVACWLPFFVTYIITPFLPECSIPGVLMSLLTWLGWFNSAINPFIYAFYSLDFRAAFWRLTFRHCSKDQAYPQQFHRRRK